MRAEAEREYVEYLRARLSYLHRAAYLLCGDADRADDLDVTGGSTLLAGWAATDAEEPEPMVWRC